MELADDDRLVDVGRQKIEIVEITPIAIKAHYIDVRSSSPDDPLGGAGEPAAHVELVRRSLLDLVAHDGEILVRDSKRKRAEIRICRRGCAFRRKPLAEFYLGGLVVRGFPCPASKRLVIAPL